MGIITVREQTQVAEARRRAAAMAGSLGGTETAVGNVSIIVTELATNLVRHGEGGELLIQPWKDTEGSGIEILALDKGRGMTDVAACFTDGYSTAGTPGTGLGAIRRLASFVDVWSRPGMGTALLVRVRFGPGGGEKSRFVWGAVSRPATGEDECGDAWTVVQDDAAAAFFVADGLGHGKFAAVAANAAVRMVEERGLRDSPADLMQAIHRGIASTRGAAAAVAVLRAGTDDLCFCGIGNISGTVLSETRVRKMVSISGTLGHAMATPREFAYPAPVGSVLILHSDGLLTNWSLEGYPGLLARHAALIAGVMYRDFKRGRDDATVLVGRRTA
jgi:anti-sigma regulatory factor (Ser/Thr protein kinase)